MRTQCRCLGLSGSCTTRQCVKVLPNFEDVSIYLKDKYDQAIEVIERRNAASKRQLVPVSSGDYGGSIAKNLVHLQQSPDFCEPNVRVGSLGTRGRFCNATAKTTESCELMCCSRQYSTRRYTKVVDCNCKFEYCCRIKCDRCNLDVVESTCT